jgi:hypothetical protein
MIFSPAVDLDDCPFLTLRERTSLLSDITLCRLPKHTEPFAVMYRWDPSLVGTATAAKFDPSMPDTIRIAAIKKIDGNAPASLIMQVTPAIIHELVHLHQYKTLGPVLYFICSLPGLYSLFLDQTAILYETLAERELGII